MECTDRQIPSIFGWSTMYATDNGTFKVARGKHSFLEEHRGRSARKKTAGWAMHLPKLGVPFTRAFGVSMLAAPSRGFRWRIRFVENGSKSRIDYSLEFRSRGLRQSRWDKSRKLKSSNNSENIDVCRDAAREIWTPFGPWRFPHARWRDLLQDSLRCVTDSERFAKAPISSWHPHKSLAVVFVCSYNPYEIFPFLSQFCKPIFSTFYIWSGAEMRKSRRA